RFGSSVSEAGDVNGDGYADFLVGAFGYSTNTGRAYLFYGSSVIDTNKDYTLIGSAANDDFGNSVSSAGDVNGDGYSDILIGSPGFNSDAGAAFLYFGSSTFNTNSDVTFNGVTAGDKFGYCVSQAGDVNCDGYSDLICGAPFYLTGTGRTYVYYGGIITNNNVDVTLTGESEASYFGYSLANAGDANNDGYDDVVIGAYNYDDFDGKIYFYNGGVTMNNVADVTVAGDAESYFGLSVAPAGDMNKDGFDDVIVGGTLYNSFLGRADIIFSTPQISNPNLYYAKDIPFDQGGKVLLKWTRSGYDQRVGGIITNYLIERSVPPNVSGYAWEQVTTIPANYNTQYSYSAFTYSDSMTSNSGSTFFRITAQTAVQNQFWKSNITSAYSVDNISPAAPTLLSAFPDINSVYLTWNANTESDLLLYNIYKNGILIGTSGGNNFDDAAVVDDSTYNYTVAAVDIHGNVSPLSNIAVVNYNVAGTLNLTVIIQGFYNVGSDDMNQSDTARVYLRNSVSPYAITDSAKGIVNKTSHVGSFKFYNAPSGNYYIVFKHRNSIETWSSSVVNYVLLSTISYNFTNTVTQAFGSNAVQVNTSPVRFAAYNGDINQDGIIDASDLSGIENDALISLSGYVNTDITGDDIVDASDISLVENNSALGVSVITP
ncbi:MAG TPA: hypothetical protein PKD83_13905, partial [Ignavibacteria bacterium]|nr:hypothetical protein [Ignavibacteria bacterium]